ncbi:hypothetical protein [Caulobacter mirabilis]|nr:hypothetical protein [Caulobacter mirabilis]
MRIFVSVVLAATLAGTGASAAAAQADEAEATSAAPTIDEAGLAWKRLPKLYDMARHYPTRARVLGIRRGLAAVECVAQADGDLDCAVVREEPADVFFGKAALLVMDKATVQSVDGGSPEGRRFRMTLRFGYWPPSARGDDAIIAGSDLKWRLMPPIMKYWNGSGLPKGESFWVEVSCVADEAGRPACELRDPGNGSKGYAAAVLKAMDDARVTAIDGGSPAGKTFTYRPRLSIE